MSTDLEEAAMAGGLQWCLRRLRESLPESYTTFDKNSGDSRDLLFPKRFQLIL
jgi:hypothetical protein